MEENSDEFDRADDGEREDSGSEQENSGSEQENSGSEQEEDESETENDDDVDSNPEKNLRPAKGGKLIYNPTSRCSYYPSRWNGPQKTSTGTSDLYGLIICIDHGVCYILTRDDMFSYRPEFMGKKHEVTGCWVLLQLDSANEICKVPTYVKPPLHTRVFDGEPFPSILVYDCVKVLSSDEVESKFLGRIVNDSDKIGLRKMNGELWEDGNVEYMITCEIDKKGRFMHKIGTVKFHGAIPLYSDLPLILSLMPGQYHKTVFDIEGRFNKAFFGEEEIRRRKEKACQERRNNRMLKERHRWALLPNTETTAESEATDEVKNSPNDDSGVKSEVAATNEEKEVFTGHATVMGTSKIIGEPIEQKTTVFTTKNVRPRQAESTQHAPSISEYTQSIPPLSMATRPAPTSSSNGLQYTNRPYVSNAQATYDAFSAQTSRRIAKRKTVIVTNAAFGHAYNLVEEYLRSNYNVVLHCADPETHTYHAIIERLRSIHKERFRAAQGLLKHEQFVEDFIQDTIDRYGGIDIVFHFASAVCKIGERNEQESLRYLFEVNVKEFICLSKHLTNKTKYLTNKTGHDAVSLIAVGPIFNQRAIHERFIPSINCFLSYLHVTCDQIAAQQHLGVNVYVVTTEDFRDIDFDDPNANKRICHTLMDIQKSLSN